MRKVNECTVWVMVCLLSAGPVFGQKPSSGQRLRIIPLEGNNAVNYLPILTITPPVVEVRDENERPVGSATVTFKAPTTGATATFDGSPIFTGITDARGQIGVPNYKVNDKPGRFTIEVTAVHDGRAGMLLINQSNSLNKLPPEISGKGGGKKKWLYLGLAAAAGAGLGIYFGTRNGSPAPISVGSGPVTIGGPR